MLFFLSLLNHQLCKTLIMNMISDRARNVKLIIWGTLVTSIYEPITLIYRVIGFFMSSFSPSFHRDLTATANPEPLNQSVTDPARMPAFYTQPKFYCYATNC